LIKNTFAVVGDRDNSKGTAYCEEYSIVEDKWKELPMLNQGDSYYGTAFLNERYLYAIGGYTY
jgi:hypothetical protein